VNGVYNRVNWKEPSANGRQQQKLSTIILRFGLVADDVMSGSVAFPLFVNDSSPDVGAVALTAPPARGKRLPASLAIVDAALSDSPLPTKGRVPKPMPAVVNSVTAANRHHHPVCEEAWLFVPVMHLAFFALLTRSLFCS